MSDRDLMLAAWTAGFQAQRAGHRIERNPHPQSGPLHWRWRLGWTAALDTQGAVEPRDDGADFAASAAAVAASASERDISQDARRQRGALRRRRAVASMAPLAFVCVIGLGAGLVHSLAHPADSMIVVS